MADEERLKEIYDRVRALPDVDLTGFSDVSYAEWHDVGPLFMELFHGWLVDEGWGDESAYELSSMMAGPTFSLLSSASGGRVDVLQLIALSARAGLELGAASAVTRRVSGGTLRAMVESHVDGNRVARESIDFSRELDGL